MQNCNKKQAFSLCDGRIHDYLCQYTMVALIHIMKTSRNILSANTNGYNSLLVDTESLMFHLPFHLRPSHPKVSHARAKHSSQSRSHASFMRGQCSWETIASKNAVSAAQILTESCECLPSPPGPWALDHLPTG